MLRTVLLALGAAWLSLAPQAAPPDPTLAFEAAAQDPAAVVPLILEVSQVLPRVDGETGKRYADRLEPFLRRAFFSGEKLPGAERLGIVEHVVRAGELPSVIAKRYGIGAGLLRYLNQDYDERRLAVGRKLRVLDLSNGSLQLIVDKERFRLSAWHRAPGGEYVLSMYVPVGLGAVESPTPSGRTKIVDRVRDPDWTDPKTHVVHRAGEEGNVLGGYWIKLDSAGIGTTGIGLHGYTGAPAPDWIESGASSGCVRLLQPDIDCVFELALEGTPVVLSP